MHIKGCFNFFIRNPEDRALDDPNAVVLYGFSEQILK